jgi:hypothetical protein
LKANFPKEEDRNASEVQETLTGENKGSFGSPREARAGSLRITEVWVIVTTCTFEFF